MILSNGKDNESDGLDMYDTKIKFYLANGKTSNNYPVPGGTTKNLPLLLTSMRLATNQSSEVHIY